MYTNNDYDAIRICLQTCNRPSFDLVRMARIRNTLRLHEIEVSGCLYGQLKDNPDIEYLDGPYKWHFDGSGNLLAGEF